MPAIRCPGSRLTRAGSIRAGDDAVGGATPAANVQPADTRRADPRADGRQQDAERAQPSPRNSAAQRDTIAQPFAVDENIPGANLGGLAQPRRQSRIEPAPRPGNGRQHPRNE
jgi:hypothetical protein